MKEADALIVDWLCATAYATEFAHFR